MTNLATWLVITSALVAPEGTFLPHNSQWAAYNTYQQHVVNHLNTWRKDLSLFKPEELQSWVSNDHEELNAILRQHGFPSLFNPFGGGFGSLAIMHLFMEWINKPTIKKIEFYQDGNMPTKSIKGLHFTQDFQIYKSSHHQSAVLKITTKSGDAIFMTLAGKNNESIENISTTIETIRTSLQKDDRHFDSVTIPTFAVDKMIDISGLEGMTSGDTYIAEAKEYLKLKLDENGCQVHAAVALTCKCISLSYQYCIDEPFYFWIERPGQSGTLIEGFIDADALEEWTE